MRSDEELAEVTIVEVQRLELEAQPREQTIILPVFSDTSEH